MRVFRTLQDLKHHEFDNFSADGARGTEPYETFQSLSEVEQYRRQTNPSFAIVAETDTVLHRVRLTSFLRVVPVQLLLPFRINGPGCDPLPTFHDGANLLLAGVF